MSWQSGNWDPRSPRRSSMRVILHMEDDSEYLCTPNHFRNQESTLLRYQRPKKLDGFTAERPKKLDICTTEVQETGSTATPGRNSNFSSQCGIEDMLLPNDDKELPNFVYDTAETYDQNCNKPSLSLDSMRGGANLPHEAKQQDMISKLQGWLLAWDVGVKTITVEQLQDLYDTTNNQVRHAYDNKIMADAQEKIHEIEAVVRQRDADTKVLEYPLKTKSLQKVDWQNELEGQDKLSTLRGWLAAREVGVRTISVEQLRAHCNVVMCHGELANACEDMKNAQERICTIESAERLNETKRQDQLSRLRGWLLAWDVGVHNITVKQLQNFHDTAVCEGGHAINGVDMVEARSMIQKVEVATQLRAARAQFALSTLRGWLAAREIGVCTVTMTQLEELYNTAKNASGSNPSHGAIKNVRQRLDKLITKDVGE